MRAGEVGDRGTEFCAAMFVNKNKMGCTSSSRFGFSICTSRRQPGSVLDGPNLSLPARWPLGAIASPGRSCRSIVGSPGPCNKFVFVAADTTYAHYVKCPSLSACRCKKAASLRHSLATGIRAVVCGSGLTLLH